MHYDQDLGGLYICREREREREREAWVLVMGRREKGEKAGLFSICIRLYWRRFQILGGA
jgi:hypothetical protein